MATQIKITQRQAPQFRALIKTEDDGELFDASEDLATASELAAEGITRAPISCTVYKSTDSLAPYKANTAKAEPVTGYVDVAIDAAAFIDPEEASAYNFAYTLANRETFAFNSSGYYFVDFLIYPKTGAAISFRVSVEVA